jgi:hypothetical protein
MQNTRRGQPVDREAISSAAPFLAGQPAQQDEWSLLAKPTCPGLIGRGAFRGWYVLLSPLVSNP